MALMKSNRIILFSILLIGCTNSSNNNEMKNKKSKENFESCRSYSEYYKRYKQDLDFVRHSAGLSEQDTLMGSAITYLKKYDLSQVFAKNSTICDSEKIMKYSLTVEDENGKVADSIVEITNAYQYEAIFFRDTIDLNKKVLPPEIK